MDDGGGNSWSKLQLILESGATKGDSDIQGLTQFSSQEGFPASIRSRFYANAGVYLARVKFDDYYTNHASNNDTRLSTSRAITQAFWLDAPAGQYDWYQTSGFSSNYKEYDLEFATWFGTSSTGTLRNNRLTSNVYTLPIADPDKSISHDCRYHTTQSVPNTGFISGCVFNDNNDFPKSFITGETNTYLNNNSNLQAIADCGQQADCGDAPGEEEFFTLAILIHPLTISTSASFTGRNYSYRGISGVSLFIYGSSWNTWREIDLSDTIVDTKRPLNINISNQISDNYSARNTYPIQEDIIMSVDWVYYSDDPLLIEMNPSQLMTAVENEVEIYRSNGILRANTAQVCFDSTYDPYNHIGQGNEYSRVCASDIEPDRFDEW